MKKILIFTFAVLILITFSLLNAYASVLGQIKITANGNAIIGTLEDNPASRAFYDMLPTTFHMRDLYEREMCYNMPKALPTGQLTARAYQVGDIIYWPPRHSFVILYKQNGERFQRQHLGHIDYGVEIFEITGDAVVTFEKLELSPENNSRPNSDIPAPEKIEFVK